MSATLMPFLAPAPAGAAVVPAVPGPATVLTVFPWEGSMEDELQGSLCQSPNTCRRVDQFLWDPSGLATIDKTIDTTPGIKVVFSYSEGARSVTRWLNKHAGDADAPSPDELSFVVIGNPTRLYGGSDSDVMPQTQYQVIDITRQYDMASDFPDNPLNLLALLNSLAAFTVIHTDYEGVDMYDDANIVWKEGNITYVFVPTKNLPLLEPLRQLGLTSLADALNEPLKKLVEQGYDRSYLPSSELPGPAPVSTLSAEPAPEPTARVADQDVAPHDADPAAAEPAAVAAGSGTASDESGDVADTSPPRVRRTTKRSIDEEKSGSAVRATEQVADLSSADEDDDPAESDTDSGTGEAATDGDTASTGDGSADGDSDSDA